MSESVSTLYLMFCVFMSKNKTQSNNKWFDKPFDRLTVLSKVEGLTTLSNVEG